MPQIGDILSDEQAMRLAMSVASGGAGFVAPNPLVGCVILDRESRFLASGFHRKLGGPHAEIEALNAIQDARKLDGAQVFVTLEPCAHHGRTPPCAETLSNFPIRRVVYGLVDPNPQVAGKGAARLAEAGKKVELFPGLKNELEEVAEVFLCNIRHHQSFIAVKVATSLDGYLGLKNQGGRMLTGEDSQRHVQYLRGIYDGIMVGRATFELDDPRLNIRDERFLAKKNKVFVVDPEGKGLSFLKDSRLIASHQVENIVWLVRKPVSGAPVTQWELPWREGDGFDWLGFSRKAHEEGVASVLVEGGPRLIASMVEQKVVRRWMQFVAPIFLGSEGLGLNLSRGWRLDQVQIDQFGSDLFFSGRVP